jgi:hypothetical protein
LAVLKQLNAGGLLNGVISDHQQSLTRLLPGIFHLPSALLLVAEAVKI